MENPDSSVGPKTFRMPSVILLPTKKATSKPGFHMPSGATARAAPKETSFQMPRTVKRNRPEAPKFQMPAAARAALQLIPKADLPGSMVFEGSSQSHSQDGAMLFSSSPGQPLHSSNTASSLTSLAADTPPSEELLYVCPICQCPVSAESLAALESTLPAATAHNRARFQHQAAFCRAHRENEARQEWSARGYPTIEWAQLHCRFERYRATLHEILENSRLSYFRGELDRQMAQRRAQGEHTARSALIKEFMRDADNGEHVGYYGGRGGGIMMSWIAQSLAAPLRSASATDPLVRACGSVSAFVQSVLVPELASLLVAEDVRTEDGAKSSDAGATEEELERARIRLRDSAELGRVLCQDVDDDILVEDGDGNERGNELSLDSELSSLDEDHDESDNDIDA